MAAAGRADVEDVLAERLQHRLERREVGRLGADHGVQAPFLGLLGRARQRRIDVARCRGGEVGAEPLGRRRLGGRGVDHDQAVARAREQALRAVDDLLDLRRAGDAEEDDVGAARAPRHCSSPPARRRRAGRRGVMRLRLTLKVSGIALGQQVLRHAVAHHADADESDPRRCAHACPSLSRMGGGGGVAGGAARASSPEGDQPGVARGDVVDHRVVAQPRRRTSAAAASAKIERPTAKPAARHAARRWRSSRSSVVLARFQPEQQHAAAVRVVALDHRVDRVPLGALVAAAAASTSRAGRRRRRSAPGRAASGVGVAGPPRAAESPRPAARGRCRCRRAAAPRSCSSCASRSGGGSSGW